MLIYGKWNSFMVVFAFMVRQATLIGSKLERSESESVEIASGTWGEKLEQHSVINSAVRLVRELSWVNMCDVLNHSIILLLFESVISELCEHT